MLLLRERASRLQREAEARFDQMVEAVAVGLRVATQRPAASAWQQRMVGRHGSTKQNVDEYRATVSRLASLTSRGRKLGLVN